MEEAAQSDGIFQGHRNNSTISAEAYFSLQHRCICFVLEALRSKELSSIFEILPAGRGVVLLRGHLWQAAFAYPCNSFMAQRNALLLSCGSVGSTGGGGTTGGAGRTLQHHLKPQQAHTFWLRCRQELLEDLPVAEVEEMRTAVQDALEAVAGAGWRLINVGGGARGIRSHDCDFVVTHDSNKWVLLDMQRWQS